MMAFVQLCDAIFVGLRLPRYICNDQVTPFQEHLKKSEILMVS